MNPLSEYNSLKEYIDAADPYYLRNEISLNIDEREQLAKLLEKVKNSNDNTGKDLEQFVATLFRFLNLHKVYLNRRTSTNEIDLFLKATDLSKTICEKAFPLLVDNFLIECKHYDKKLSVTWVGKFYSLLRQADFKVGLMFTVKPLTGKNDWHAAKGLCSKVALKENVYIINFDIKDMEKISEGTNFFEILDAKFDSIKYSIDFEQDITEHENENILK